MLTQALYKMLVMQKLIVTIHNMFGCRQDLISLIMSLSFHLLKVVLGCSSRVALLFFFIYHVQKYGFTVSILCAGQECTWNKRKKRENNPCQLLDTQYPTKMKKSRIPVADFDARPIHHRQKASHINDFVTSLQKISSTSNSLSMWETHLSIESTCPLQY